MSENNEDIQKNLETMFIQLTHVDFQLLCKGEREKGGFFNKEAG